MNRTIVVIAVALAVLVAGCGGPGDAPEDDEAMPEEEPDDPAEDDPEEPAEDDEPSAIAPLGVTAPLPG